MGGHYSTGKQRAFPEVLRPCFTVPGKLLKDPPSTRNILKPFSPHNAPLQCWLLLRFLNIRDKASCVFFCSSVLTGLSLAWPGSPCSFSDPVAFLDLYFIVTSYLVPKCSTIKKQIKKNSFDLFTLLT